MPDSRNPLSWAAYAEEDYQTAIDILEKHPRNAVYCFEQAAEKYLKALLTRNSVAPRSHDLPQLLLLIDPEFDLQSRVMKAAQLLTRVAIRGRYPGNLPEPNLEEAQAIGCATALLREYACLALGLTPYSGFHIR